VRPPFRDLDTGGGDRHHDDSRWAVSASWPWGLEYVGAFTIGDQLLWGAAEPLRRMLRILL